MRRPGPALVLTLSVSFMVGCFSTIPAPLPEPAERSSDIRGVVRDDGAEGERVEFDTVDQVQWSTSEVVLTGILEDEAVTRSFPLSSLSGVLVRQVDAAKTSMIIAGLFLGAIVTVALLVTGQARDGVPLPGVR